MSTHIRQKLVAGAPQRLEGAPQRLEAITQPLEVQRLVTDINSTIALLPRARHQGKLITHEQSYVPLILTASFFFQPDGFLTDERKAADPDHGFSTFFSETGTIHLLYLVVADKNTFCAFDILLFAVHMY